MKEETRPRLLDEVMVAAPCNADWNEMSGDDRVRFCQLCQLNVFNIAALTESEAETLLRSKSENPEARLCLRLYRREDGTIITSNCPVGVEKFKKRMEDMRRSRNLLVRSAAAAALLAVNLFTPAQADEQQNKSQAQNKSQCKSQSQSQNQNPASNEALNNARNMARMGDVALPATTPPVAKMGEAVARPTPAPSPSNVQQPAHPEVADADRTALNFLNEAKRSVAAGKYDLAESNFKQALKAVEDKKHDPKFRDSIKKEYAEFLKKMKAEGKK